MFANDTKATKQKNLYGLNFAFILSSRFDQIFSKKYVTMQLIFIKMKKLSRKTPGIMMETSYF